jgi:hypothetical protein
MDLEYYTRKETHKMNETKSIVKTVLAFILTLVLIAGSLFGIDVPYDVGDLEGLETEGVVDEQAPVEDEQNDVDVPAEDNANTEDGEQTDEPQDSTPTEDDEVVDNSAEDEVADPAEDETDATEGDVENA